MPGVTNKILSRYVRKVFLGYKEGGKYFHGKAELEYTGNPIRSEILQHTREEAVKELGLDPAKKTILVSGGSRGARTSQRYARSRAGAFRQSRGTGAACNR